jgi:hypothetical protein
MLTWADPAVLNIIAHSRLEAGLRRALWQLGHVGYLKGFAPRGAAEADGVAGREGCQSECSTPTETP